MRLTTHHYITVLSLSLSITWIAPSWAENGQQHQAAADTSQVFMQALGRAMKTEMKQNGPVAAIKVCTEMSPTIAGEISREKGWKVTRVGTRVRNPMLAMPDAWEQKVLANFQARADEGESFQSMTYSEWVDEPNGKAFRFMKAIGVKPVCLTCHGGPSDIPEPVKNILGERYPHDQATGYKKGDLRGAVSIKQPGERM
ncbi:DUF3365 domain-containing protein [Pseudomonadota bacterium]